LASVAIQVQPSSEVEVQFVFASKLVGLTTTIGDIFGIEMITCTLWPGATVPLGGVKVTPGRSLFADQFNSP